MKKIGTRRNFVLSRGAAIAALAGLLFLSGLAAALVMATTDIPDDAEAPGVPAADRVLGQPDFTHNAPNTVDATSMNAGGHLALDKSVTPNRLYVADRFNHRVLGYNDVAAFVNGAPADLVIGQPDFFSSACNTGGVTPNSLCTPEGVAVDSAGNLFVADFSNNRVLEYTSPFAACGGVFPCVGRGANVVFGQGEDFFAGSCNNGGTQPTSDSLCQPVGVALDSAGNLFVTDFGNNRVLEYNTPLTNTTANFVFGQGGVFNTGVCNKGGLSPNSLCGPHGVALDSAGNLFVADNSNHRVLEYNAPLTATANNVFGQGGSFFLNLCNNGGVSANSLCTPHGIALDGAGNLFVADFSNNRVLEYDTPLANTTANFVFGQGAVFTTNTCNLGGVSADSLCSPAGVGVDSGENVYIVDRSNNRVLQYTTPLSTGNTTASVVLGQFDFAHNSPNSVDPAAFAAPWGVAVDKSVLPNRLYVADSNNHRVLGYLNAATFLSGAPADLVIGQPDFLVGLCNNGGLNASRLCTPRGVAVDVAGNLYVADSSNNRVLQYTNPFDACGGVFPCVGGDAVVVFGQGGVFTTGGCNQGGLSADSLCNPQGVAVDSAGNLFVGDFSNHRVLAFTDGATTAAVVFGQGGDFTTNVCNKGGLSSNSLCNPVGVALDSADNLYVADNSNHRVLEYNTPLANTTANIVFGQGGSFTLNFCNNGGVSANSLCGPNGVALDGANKLFVADFSNNRVLEYNTPLTNTTANFVFGQNSNFTSSGCNLFGTRPSRRTLCNPTGVSVDAAGNVLIADFSNNRVLEYDTPIP